jgi:dihydrofolate reductase
MELILIAAIGKNRELGHKGQIPWRLPNDLKHFKKTTEGHVVVMGRKTYESIPECYRPLPGRINVVLSRSAGQEDYPGCLVFSALHEVVSHFAREGEKIIFVAGGGEIYKEAICDSKEMIITEVDGDFEADTFFPLISDAWRGRTVETFPKNEGNQYKFSIRHYEKVVC